MYITITQCASLRIDVPTASKTKVNPSLDLPQTSALDFAEY